MLPVYADLWLHRANPLVALNHALEETLDAARVPKRAVGKIAKTTVTGVSVPGFGIHLGASPQPRDLPESPELRLDSLIVRLADATDRKILLMLDEVQTLSEFPKELIATLRAVLHQRRGLVDAVFTGSSQDGLAKLMTTVGAPMYQFAQLIMFPVLGDEYLLPLCEHFTRVHPGKRLELEQLRALFARIGHKPALLRDIVKTMSAEGIADPETGLRCFLDDERHVAGWHALLNAMSTTDVAYLSWIAQGNPPLAKRTLEALGTTLSKARTSLRKLTAMGILAPRERGVGIEDPLLAEYLIRCQRKKDQA